jgi:hypothetical protein
MTIQEAIDAPSKIQDKTKKLYTIEADLQISEISGLVEAAISARGRDSEDAVLLLTEEAEGDLFVSA